MLKRSQTLQKIENLLKQALEECEKAESKTSKVTSHILIDTKGGGDINMGDIYVNQTLASIKIENKLLQIQNLLESSFKNCLVTDTLNFNQLKKEAMQKALEITNGHVDRAAALVGISPSGVTHIKRRNPEMEFVPSRRDKVSSDEVRESYLETKNQKKTARLLGVSERTVRTKLKK